MLDCRCIHSFPMATVTNDRKLGGLKQHTFKKTIFVFICGCAGVKPVSPALVGGFFTTVPPGK